VRRGWLLRGETHRASFSAVPTTIGVIGGIDRLAFAALRASETTGRALGSGDFVATSERATGRRLRPKKPGRKPSAPTDQPQLRMPGMNSEA
jgi:hypothetical protein